MATPQNINPYGGEAPAIILPGNTVLPFGTIADGEFLKRVGDEIVGASAGGDFQSHAIHIDIDDLLAGVQTIYTPAAGEFIIGILIADSVNLDTPGKNVLVGITPRLDNLDGSFYMAYLYDTYFAAPADGWYTLVASALGSVTLPAVSDGAFPISGPLYAFIDAGAYVVGPWEPNHFYDVDLYGVGDGLNVVGNDGYIWNIGSSGTSGAVSPNFAGNHGGSVVDNDITWFNYAAVGAAPTVGSVDLLLMTVQT